MYSDENEATKSGLLNPVESSFAYSISVQGRRRTTVEK